MRELQAKQVRRRRLQRVAVIAIAVLAVAGLIAVAALARSGNTQVATTTTVAPTTTLPLPAGGAASSTTTKPGPITTTTFPGGAGGAGGSTTTAATTTTAAPTTSSTAPATTSTARPTATTKKQASASTGKVVVIDPGHQGGNGPGGVEPVGPGSSTMKAKYAYGTSGVATKTPESELVLAVSFKLRDALEARGITAIMERTSQSQALSNVERAQIANENHADLFIRVHADGVDNQSTHGISVLTPASIKGWTETIAGPSKQAAQLALNALVAATGASNRGLSVRSDMTGFNWSKVPVILPEIGFMTNPTEDRNLATAAYQQKIANALADAAVQFIQEQRG